MEKSSIRIDYGGVKRVLFKNNYVLGFSLFAFFFFLVSILVTFNINLIGFGNTAIFQLFFLFSPWIWFFLFLMFSLSSVAAYYEKYSLMFLPILIWLLFTTAYVRTQNISQLKDVTTGDWTLGPDLDPFLFLRNAIEISEGRISPVDNMRYAPLWKPNSYVFSNIMPWSIFLLYKGMSLFTETSVTYAAIIAPVVFFFLSTLFFFLFVSNLFSYNFSKKKSSLIALIATTFYIFSTQMLHRTVAGIPELESLGMVWFWLAFLFFSLAWKQKKVNRMILFGVLAGLFTGAMHWTWGGYRYIYMAISLVVLLSFLFNINSKKNLVTFSSWIVPAIIIGILKTGSLGEILVSFNDTGLALGVFFIIIVDKLIYSTKIKDYLKLEKVNLPKSIKSVLISILLVVLLLLLIKPSLLISIFSVLIEKLLYPFGRGRIGLTVAENRAPYFAQVFGSFGYLFWAFFFGLIMIFYEATKHFNIKKKITMNSFFIIFISSFIFSRISPGHLFNGNNFISKTLYLGGLLVFVLVLLYIYIKAYKERDEKTLWDFKKIKFSYLLVLALSFLAIVSMRGAVRLFFIIAPLLIIVSAYFIVKFSEYTFSLKDPLLRFVVGVVFVLTLILLINTFAVQAISTTQSAKATFPSSYNQQWQYAMEWVRDNTPEGSIFTHWWDYGYWVQTIGQRPTTSDGGHYIGFWDHTIGRYLLTTPRPETALSLMKTHNVSYLLIDSTDLGKYGAYSSIGSGSGNESNDRYSAIPVMPLDQGQTKETSNVTSYVYSGGMFVDEDIIYNLDGKEIFLPSGSSAIGGVILGEQKGEPPKFVQPIGVYIYNNQRYDLPLRYVYFEGQIYDFGSGIEAVVRIIPSIGTSNINPKGAAIYLSPKISKTLFAQLYLLNDVFKEYGTIELVRSEPDAVVRSLRGQGIEVGDFVYYRGFRGPIKIWKVSYPDNILERKEFLKTDGEYAELDNLKFTK